MRIYNSKLRKNSSLASLFTINDACVCGRKEITDNNSDTQHLPISKPVGVVSLLHCQLFLPQHFRALNPYRTNVENRVSS